MRAKHVTCVDRRKRRNKKKGSAFVAFICFHLYHTALSYSIVTLVSVNFGKSTRVSSQYRCVIVVGESVVCASV